MKDIRIRLLYLAVGIVIGLLTALYAPALFAHPGGMAKDGCHNDRSAGERHYHESSSTNRMGKCVEIDGISYRTIEIVVEKEVIVEVPIETVVKTPDVEAFEKALDRLDAAIEKEAIRSPRVVEVRVPDWKPTTKYCEGLRIEFFDEMDQWFGDPTKVAALAIDEGCW